MLILRKRVTPSKKSLAQQTNYSPERSLCCYERNKVVDVVVKICPFERKIGNAILKGAKKLIK